MRSVHESYGALQYTCEKDICVLKEKCVKQKLPNAAKFVDACLKNINKLLPKHIRRQNSLSASRKKKHKPLRNRAHGIFKEMAVCLNVLHITLNKKDNDIFFGFKNNIDPHFKILNSLFKTLKYCFVNRLRSEMGIIQFYIRNKFFDSYVNDNQHFLEIFSQRVKKFQRQGKKHALQEDVYKKLVASHDAYLSYIHTHHLEFEMEAYVKLKEYKLMSKEYFKLYHVASIIHNYITGIRSHVLPEEIDTFIKLMNRRRLELISINQKTPIGSLVKLKESFIDCYYDDDENPTTVGITLSKIFGDSNYLNNGMVVEVLCDKKVEIFRIKHLEVINERYEQ